MIGDHTFEISSEHDGYHEYWIDGKYNRNGREKTRGDLPAIAGYAIRFEHENSQKSRYVVELSNGGDEKVTFQTWKRMIRVDFSGCTEENFEESLGLMGTFTTGDDGKRNSSFKMGRDKKTVFEDISKFGQEWQVQANEPRLFHKVDDSIPQAPTNASCQQRRLCEDDFQVQKFQQKKQRRHVNRYCK